MIDRDRLKRVVSEISLGAFRPAMTIEVTTKVTSDASRLAVLIGMDARDVEDPTAEPIRLYECHAVPDLPDRELALWIYERCQDIILHEMDEFIRFRGEPLVVAKHPVSEEVFAGVRARHRQNL